MPDIWLTLAAGLAIALMYVTHLSRSLDTAPYKVCIRLNLNDDTCNAAIVARPQKGGSWYVVLSPFTHMIGDVAFGDRLISGDCDYKSRMVFLGGNEHGCKVVKVRTVATDLYVTLEEYVEAQPDTKEYIKLQRQPIDVDMNAKEFPDRVYPLYNVHTRATDIDIHPKFSNGHRIGMVTIADQVVPDVPCIHRSIHIIDRKDGRRVVSVATTHSNEVVTYKNFIEQSAGRGNFVPYTDENGTEDLRIGSVADEM
ncbi:uncharacterized protein BXIN_1185 [Babesia sp. Xinjiang]|uniref:uncharacterized protein n=1 Tax=Babesia sp. Xinjiang TaxID=462227 RepID=UPI000A2417DF|nr:uncharacterized protein BXIN_1185 [Babesia sp. Xinjiang]ORM40029.1 hypothetical protein BXIN_1185 [Babesia sp. Xinjiang]